MCWGNETVTTSLYLPGSSFLLWRLQHEQYSGHTSKEEPFKCFFALFGVITMICRFPPLTHSSLSAQLHPALLYLQVTVQVLWLFFQIIIWIMHLSGESYCVICLFPSNILIFVIFSCFWGHFHLKLLYVLILYCVLQVCKKAIVEMNAHFFLNF